MKHFEKSTLVTTLATTTAAAAAVCAGFLIQHVVRIRSERLFRLAAGESPYERTHPKLRTCSGS
jgi:hypothetical protein